MSTTVSRGIDSRPACPPPMRMSRIESERLGPLVLPPPPCGPFRRRAAPRTRKGGALNGGVPWPARAPLAASSTCELWICAETRKRTSERASHAPTAIDSHFRTRRAVIRPRANPKPRRSAQGGYRPAGLGRPAALALAEPREGVAAAVEEPRAGAVLRVARRLLGALRRDRHGGVWWRWRWGRTA